MKFISALLLGIGLVASSCATPNEISVAAQRHEAAAQTARAQGDYRTAESEQRAADKQWAKAGRRSQVYGGGPVYW